MVETKILTALRDAKANYDAAVKRNLGVSVKKQTLTNILLTHAGELIETALDAEYLMKKNAENNKKISDLEAQIAKLTAKPDVDAAEEQADSSIKKKNG